MRMMGFIQRKHFLANYCQTCRKANPTVECEICHLVFYCSKSDRKKDWQAHSHLCRAVYKVCQLQGVERLYQDAEGSTPERFRNMRNVAAMQCTQFLGRDLQSWELEVLYWPKYCGHCFKLSSNLLCCKSCNFLHACCVDHFSSKHKEWCGSLLLYHEIIHFLEEEGVPDIPAVEVPSDAILMNDVLNKSLNSSSEILKALTSELLSYPLTVYDNLRLLSLSKKVVVHLVGAELQAEVLPLSKWESYLLHLLPTSQEVTLVFVGPDLLPLDQHPMKGEVDICQKCRSEGKKLRYEIVYKTLYHHYLSLPGAAKPDLITALNAGLYRNIGFQGSDSWSPTLNKMFQEGKAPVLVTEYTFCEVTQDLQLIQKRFPAVRPLKAPEINPFASLIPNLNVISSEDVPVIFKNYFSVMLASAMLLRY